MESTAHPGQRRRAAAASSVGTCIEWYDFYVYSVAAAIVFGPVFFPSHDPLTGLAASFGTYAVGFFARPLGAIVFGHYGDRFGRRGALITTLIMMGVSTVCTGLLPTYAEVGAAAPILLVALRVVQGIATGGEWGGAVLMAVEHAPERARGFYGGFPQLGNPAGAMLATGAFSLLSMLGGEHALTGFAWRIPFLISALLIVVGIVIRARVEETPVFAKSTRTKRALPLRDAVVKNWRPLLMAVGLVSVPTGGYYITSTYFTAYATDASGFNPTFVLNVLTIGSFVELIATLPSAWLADRIGRVRVLVIGIVGMGVFGAVVFIVLDLGVAWALIAAFVILRLAGCGAYAALAVVLAQMFPRDSRYTSISLGYQVGAAVFGGLSPLLATLAFAASGTVWSVIGILEGLCVLATCCALIAPQVRDHRLLPALNDVGLEGAPGATEQDRP